MCFRSTDICQICNNLTSDQCQQLATPSYKLKKEKREAKLSDSTPSQDSDQLVDPSSVSVIGVVDEQGSVKSPAPVPPPVKKPNKDNKNSKKEKSPSTKASKHSTGTDEKFAELDSKWSERFSRLEALIMAKSFEPTFSSKVKVVPTHSPPHDVENMSEPFIRPSTSKLTGTGFSAEKHQPTSQAVTSQQASTTKFPGTGFSANKHQPASQTRSHRPTSTATFTGQGSSAIVHHYLSHLRTGIKPDTLTALRSAPFHISTLFPDSVIKRAEEDIAQLESKGHAGSAQNKGRYHPYERQDKRSVNGDPRSDKLTWKTNGKKQFRRGRGRTTTYSSRLLAGSTPQTINTCLKSNVKLPVASHVHTAPGNSQKRELSPGSAGCHCKSYKLKSVKSVSCVTQLSCVQPVTTVKNAAPNLPVGARHQNFWQTWLDLGAGPKVVQILEEGYTLPFWIRPRLCELIAYTVTTDLSGPAVHVPDWFINSHREASSPRPATHETHTVAPQKPLENTRITRKSDPNSQIFAPSFTMVATGRRHSHRPTITPNKTCSANLYRRIKRRVGRSLKRTHCQRDLVTARKQTA